ncbi:MAG: TRAP transporter substrate-binding protein [Leptospiraceae bacterium]|nr:TRAP transporter substrate-binding protein [Leptospiraceae bacterium]
MILARQPDHMRDDELRPRRHFLKQAGLVTAGLGGLVALNDCRRGRSPAEAKGPAIIKSQRQYQWTMVTTWPRNFPGLGTGANRLAERIQSMSGGQLQISVKAAGERVPALQVFDAVRSGTAELGHGAAYYWKGKLPAAQFFSAVPFGLNAQEMAAWMYHGGALKLWTELYADFGVVPLPCGNTGVQMGGWFKKEIHSAADFQGLIMRMPGLGGEVIRQVGAAAPNIPGGEIFQALDSGAIDATEWVGPYNDLAFGLYKAAPYYYYPGWHEPGTVLELLINKSAWLALPAHLQAIIQGAAQADYNEMLAEFNARNGQALDTLVHARKVQLRRFPSDLLQKLAQISREVLGDMANQDTATRKVYDSFLGFQKTALGWNQIGESAYDQARLLDPAVEALLQSRS